MPVFVSSVYVLIQSSLSPLSLNPQATEEKAKSAPMSSFVGVLALGNLIKLTPGPKAVNKILQPAESGDIKCKERRCDDPQSNPA